MGQDYYKSSRPGLNVRKGAGTEYKIVGHLKKGDKVEIIAKAGKWFQIKSVDEHIQGYVFSEYLVKCDNISTGTVPSSTDGALTPDIKLIIEVVDIIVRVLIFAFFVFSGKMLLYGKMFFEELPTSDKVKNIIIYSLATVAAVILPFGFWGIVGLKFFGVLVMMVALVYMGFSIWAGRKATHYLTNKMSASNIKVLAYSALAISAISICLELALVFNVVKIFEVHLFFWDLLKQTWTGITFQKFPKNDWFLNSANNQLILENLKDMFNRCWEVLKFSTLDVFPLSLFFTWFRL